MFFRRNRSRALLLALAASLALVYLLLQPSGPPSSAPEPVRLSWHMNHRAREPPFTKSTLDYRAIPPLNPPPEPLAKVPSPHPNPLPATQYAFADDHDGPASAAAADPLSESRRREVRALFRTNWDAYRTHAWGRDALQPLTLRGRDQFSGWAATLVDSLDALYLLGLRREFDEAVAWVASSLDLGVASGSRLNTFETTIRYLGGLLSAYELSGREVLLRRAVELGDLLYTAFDTPSRLPVDWIDLRRVRDGKDQLPESRVVSAAPGTLSLEMTRLSQLTGDERYFDAVDRLMRLFAEGQDKTALPGLWPVSVSLASEDVVRGRSFTLGGGADSLYEYLPKMHLLLEGGDPKYETMTREFLRAAERLFFRPMLPEGVDEDILISGRLDEARAKDGGGNGELVLEPETEHLTCFVGATVALAGKVLRDEDAVSTGARLARGCAYLYRATASGVMPERLTLVPCPSTAARERCAWNQTLYDEEVAKSRRWRPGTPRPFSAVADPRYILRPEAVEALFVLYRVTGDEGFREMGWEMFEAVRRATTGPGGVSATVTDVLKGAEEVQREDYMEVSFCVSLCLMLCRHAVVSPPFPFRSLWRPASPHSATI